jgi:radical SAM family uncharacterized protein/radical SAM-linked protein
MNLKNRVEEEILPRIRKPSRYLGTEVNAVHKDAATVETRVCLVFPDMYDLGLSNLGLLILYSALNARPDVWCERAYAAAQDLEEIMRAEGIPHFSLESKTPLSDFDIVGFTLQYELSYTNILNILDLGGIPIRSRDRGDGDPLIIAGGPCVFNPEPLADFVDAFAIGDGEDVVMEITDVAQATKGRPRRERLAALAAIPGVYVPALFPVKTVDGGWIVPDLDRAAPIRKRLVRNLDTAPFPAGSIVPFTEQAHDRVSLEVLRGCTQSCRFCQAGMTTRPVRERSLETLETLMRETVRRTGYEEVALSSLSTCDYSQVRNMVAQSVAIGMKEGVSVSLPSLRSDSFSVDLSDMVRTVRQSGLTFAPEAATDRMRAVINKFIAEEDLLALTDDAFSRGYGHVKLYFMIGLPTEGDEDVEEIGRLANKVLASGKRLNPRARVNLGVSTFVPKPHTPFQWDRQITVEETHAKHALLKRILGARGPKFGRHDAEMSWLEGLFSRADRRVGDLLYIVWRKGARFDGWTEHFNSDLWREAIAEWGVDPQPYLDAIPTDRPLPWDHIDALVSREYLLEDRRRSREGTLTRDCRYTRCNDCGVIHAEREACATMLKTSREGIRIESSWQRPAHLGGPPPEAARHHGQEGSRNAAVRRGREDTPAVPMEEADAPVEPVVLPHQRPAAQRLVFRFHKTGLLRYLSHLELNSAVQRALRRAGLPVAYTQGFHPQPRLAFATPQPTGMEAWNELADVALTEATDPKEFVRRLNAAAPDGLVIASAEERELNAPSLMSLVTAGDYEALLALDPAEATERAAAFLAKASHPAIRQTKDGAKTVDVRAAVEALAVEPDGAGCVVRMRLVDKAGTKGRPGEVLTAVFGEDVTAKVRKVGTVMKAEA